VFEGPNYGVEHELELRGSDGQQRCKAIVVHRLKKILRLNLTTQMVNIYLTHKTKALDTGTSKIFQ
jgi:hypothetical protein